MDRLREHFLAGAGLAEQQRAGIGFGNQPRAAQQVFHLRTAGNDAGAPVVAVAAAGRRGRAGQLRRFGDFLQQGLAVEGLGQETEDAALGGADGIGDRAVLR
jgi:hypothetical protein